MYILSLIKKLYFRFLSPNKKAEYLRRVCYHVGNNVNIYTTSIGTEPYLISIGDNVNIASGVKFITHDISVFNVRRYINYSEEHAFDKVGPIILKDNCMIGAYSILMPGCIIGENSIIAAGSVVTKSIPNNEVWGGVPAHFIVSMEEYSKKIIELNESYPWMENGKYKLPQFSDDIISCRQEFFFGKKKDDK